MKNDPYFYQGQFGLERETLRVDCNGRLAQTPHPFESDSITRDFSESQIELITPVCHSTDEMLQSLAGLDKTVREVLARNQEQIWLYSNPPHIETEDDIPVANFTGEQSSKRNYREQLQWRYGKRLMLYSGIHFNFSFSEPFLRHLHEKEADGLAFDEFSDRLYLRIYKLLCRHSWLLVLLTAVSPVYDSSFDVDYGHEIITSRYSSMRNSERGYWNEFIPVLRHDSLQSFTESIQNYVDKGLLFSASELYLPVRLKPRGINTLENLVRNGISHLELRMFDLNPLEPLGISKKDTDFAHLLILYLIQFPDFDYTPEMQEQSVKNHQNAALYDLEDVTIDGKPILKRAEEILHQMRDYFSENPAAVSVIDYETGKLSHRLCEQVIGKIYQ